MIYKGKSVQHTKCIYRKYNPVRIYIYIYILWVIKKIRAICTEKKQYYNKKKKMVE